MNSHTVKTVSGTEITDPPIARFIFNDTRLPMPLIWLVIRVVIGWDFLQAGWTKLGESGWMGDGSALKGFWETVLGINSGKALPAYSWYSSFIQVLYNAGAWTWFSKLVVAGELLVGIFLILGLFTGVAAFVGSFMNWNFAMAGIASVNVFLFGLAVLVILAWKTSGWWGLDRFVLPRLGTPWRVGGGIHPAPANTGNTPTAPQGVSR